jgi:hypothetical protein
VTIRVADPLVIELLENEFPRRVSQVEFNKQMKALCRMSKIEGLVPGFKNNPKTRRKEIVNAPKYAFVTLAIMRCSFAFNYYGKIETHQNKDALADEYMQQAGVIW